MGKITPTFADQQRGNGGVHPFVAMTPTPAVDLSPLTDVVPIAEPAPLKVALIGTAPSSRMLAPFADQSWKIWACSPGNMNALPRVDVWFEIHMNLLWPEHKSYGEPYIEWLKKQPFPIYMQDQSLVPNATPFPKEEMVKLQGISFLVKG